VSVAHSVISEGTIAIYPALELNMRDVEHFSLHHRRRRLRKGTRMMTNHDDQHRAGTPTIYLMQEGYALWTLSRGHEVEPITYYADWNAALERAARHTCDDGAVQLVDHERLMHFVDGDGVRDFARRWYIQLDL
jgi:hypothetical protein